MALKFGQASNNAGKTLTGYKYRIDTSDAPLLDLARNLGAARWLYNRYVADYKEALDNGERPTVKTPAQYKDIEGLEWLAEMDSLNLANVQLHFLEAVDRFHKGLSGFPSFKSKRNHNDSYTTNNVGENIKLIRHDGGTFLKLPKIDQPLRLSLHRPLPKDCTVKSVTISHEPDGRYYASILVSEETKPSGHAVDCGNAIGLDMSLPKLYVDSNGNSADYSKPFRKSQGKLAMEQRKLSHMKKGSKNYEKQRQRIAKLYAKTKHQRKDQLHKISHMLTENYDIIGIEDLDMSAMKQALSFGKSVSDNGWGMFTDMLKYKCLRKGKALVKVSRWFPSSKTCCVCGHVHKELKLSDRTYACPMCGNVMDRDCQAAINIRNEAVALYRKGLKPTA